MAFFAGNVNAAEMPTGGPESAWQQPAMSAEEARSFMKQLARYVFEHHLKKAADSPQRGMLYEYFDVERTGQFDQWVQGEALDTMHDGAWFAAALVNAYHVTGDKFYKDFLTQWILPFYCKMLNHSDSLFTLKRNDARPGVKPFDREHQFQEGEKGFVPYFWDDGASVSMERRQDRNVLGPFPCMDEFAGYSNTNCLLKGYSHGSSNHLAQDLGVMLELAWLLLRDSGEDPDRKLALEVALAARNLHECRMRHHGHIPMTDVPAALANHDATLMGFVPSYDLPKFYVPDNHYYRALYNFSVGKIQPFAGFADDQEYLYYAALAKHGGKMPRPLAFKLIYDAYTEPMLYRYYCDDSPAPPGMNRFDLHPYSAKDGKLEDYRSDRKGLNRQPRPAGSRMGPQNMVVCGWALQAMEEYGDIWEERHAAGAENDQPVFIEQFPPDVPAPDRESPFFEFKLGSAALGLSSTLRGMKVRCETREKSTLVKIWSRPDAKGSSATVALGETVTATNDQGQKLILEKPDIKRSAAGSKFSVFIPYTVVKNQAPWINGVPHGRYSVQIGDYVQNLYITQEEEQVKSWLWYELAGGLRTWEAVFRKKGYIPSGLGEGRWERFSDTGGYAHLISAAAQYILCLEKKKDWEQHGKIPGAAKVNEKSE
ncbi:MAG: hypothetical protein JWM16_3262 [Verrucomicrobiales bacterium]|nr:hypothetical protein [Verrucomicrobiales bacterium]